MLNSIKKNSNNYLIYQPTPWNFQALGFFSNEIKNFVFDDIEVACKMLKEFDAICFENEIRFSAIRFNANNHSEKYVLSKFNYYYAESTYVLNKKLVNLYNLKSPIPKLKLDIDVKPLRNLSEIEVSEILAIAGSTFYHGRFAEDYNFGKKISDKRNEHWIKSERNGLNEVFILKSNNIVVGFMMFSIQDETASLLLGGLL